MVFRPDTESGKRYQEAKENQQALQEELFVMLSFVAGKRAARIINADWRRSRNRPEYLQRDCRVRREEFGEECVVC